MKLPFAPLSCLALMAVAGFAPAQFDNGGGSQDSRPAYEGFKFNPKTRIKLDFRNANIDLVLGLFQRTSGVTIVKDPGLTGTITLTSAKAVPLKDAFQILTKTLELKGFEMRKEGNLLIVAKRQERQQNRDQQPPFDFSQFQTPQSELKVYPIQFANASQVARVVNEVFAGAGQPQGGFGGGRFGGGGGGNNQGRGGNQGQNQNRGFPGFGQQAIQVRASADDFSNSIIVNAPNKQQREVSDLIKQIDKETDVPQRTRVYKLTYATATDVQPVLQNVLSANAPKGRGGATPAGQAQQNLPFFLRGAGASQGQGTVAAEVRTNSVVVTATEDNQKIVASLIKELDNPVETASTTFVFPLSNARAEDISSLLNQAFGSRTGTNNRNTGRVTTPTAQRQNTSNAARNNAGLGGRARTEIITEGGVATTVDIPLEDPSAQEGELQTNISVAQGGGFGQFFGGQNNQNRNNQQGRTAGQGTARDANGRIVNVSDLTNQITVIPDNNTNSVIVVASPDGAKLIQDILAQLDRIPEQVMIETIIVEATLDDTTRLGVEFGLNIPNLGGTGTTGNAGTSFGLQNANPALQGGRYTLSGGNLTAFVNALRTDTRFNVLSTPRIFTSNNQEAQINISQSIPFVLSTRTDINGNLTFNYDFRDVGIVLTVTPRITANGYVTMDVNQTANDLQGFTDFNAPIINQREADTSVSVLDGETVVLGGIIRSTVSATTNKVPILGDIPILGQIFRSTRKTNNKTELLVLLTPRIVRDDAEARRLRLEQQNRLSVPTQNQLKKVLPLENGPIGPATKPDTDPGGGAGKQPGEKPGEAPGTPGAQPGTQPTGPGTKPSTKPPRKKTPPPSKKSD